MTVRRWFARRKREQVQTVWPEFTRVDLERVKMQLSHPIIFDGRNLFDPAEMKQLG